ncbi:LOW QUALITY PROTEIN: hypothetical protein CRUP_021375 [Coryphaenoides rupestris]|nr:LOW QUALITY PROTEIN: hypothetical protein CRUP_021375 [Coryphaenoides rupestris]
MEPAFCYGNGSCVRTVYPVIIRATLYLGLGSAVVLTVLGNLLVIVAIAHFKQLHTPTNYLTLSLAASDLLLGVLVMLPSMVRAVETCWYFGEMFCMIYTSSDVLLCTASILNLSFISIDRYYAVCHPLLYPHKITVHTALVMILVTWCVSAVVGFGMIFLKLNLLGVEEIYYNHVACEGGCILFQSGVSSTVSSILSFYIPGVIMLGIYLKIYMVAQRQARTIGLQNTSSSKVDKHQRKATKTLAIIMGVFLAFWTPFFICNIIDPFIGYSVPPTLFDTLVWLGYLNSTINPLVYAFFYSWFRKAFKIIISGSIFRHVGHKIGEQQLCYPGSNISCPRAEFHLGAQVALYTVFVLGMLVTVVGNAVVIMSIAHFKQLHSPTNVLVLSLALADLLLGVTVMPFSTVRAVQGCWFYGHAFCLLHSAFDMFLTSVSIFHLICIAVDRHEAVCNPLHYSRNITMPVAWLMVAASWALAALYSYGLLYSKANVQGLEEYLASIYCLGSCNLLFNKLWGTLDTVIAFFLPCTAMMGLYTKIFLVAREHARKIEDMGGQGGASNGKGAGGQIKRSEHKAAKTLGIVVGAFIFCWMPFFLNSIADAYTGFSTPAAIFEVFVWLGYFNFHPEPRIYRPPSIPGSGKTSRLIFTLKYSPATPRP